MPLEMRLLGTEDDASLLTAGAKWTVVPKRSVALVCGRLLGDTGTLGCARDTALVAGPRRS